ncbi:fungal-specific transcription factor domain-containing protein [Mariannaea sp. PMI_226]|nr:fungal-specific transcription factor domain-containing protein [Mariannaea sp. PMI_226]
MDDSPGSDRPVKRVKYAQQDHEPIVTMPVSMTIEANSGSAYGIPVPSVFQSPWSSQPGLASPTEVLLTLAEDPHISWTPSVPGEKRCRPTPFFKLSFMFIFPVAPFFSPFTSVHCRSLGPELLTFHGPVQGMGPVGGSYVLQSMAVRRETTTLGETAPRSLHILAFTQGLSTPCSRASVFLSHTLPPFPSLMPLNRIQPVHSPDHAMVGSRVGELTFNTVTPSASLDINDTAGQSQTLSQPHSSATSLSLGFPPIAVKASSFQPHAQNAQITRSSRRAFINPFTDEEERLVKTLFPRYARPENGQVNGYVKFHWPSRRQSTRPSVSEPSPGNDPSSNSDILEEVISDSTLPAPSTLNAGVVTLIGPGPPSSNGNVITMSPVFSEIAWGLSPSSSSNFMIPSPPQEYSAQVLLPGEPPRMIPPHFGYQAKMDLMDRRLWDFYVRNWCPGRSVLSNTNLWLKDFAQMQESEGIRSAIQSLAGVYIYDYLPDERIRNRINERYILAGEHFSRLLNSSESFEVGRGNEIITMAVILSMQDIILTERRLKKPHLPRWLEGFKQGEHFLHKTDPGGRFWRDNNIQVDSLRLSQSIIVGRAIILAQPMMELPHPSTLIPEQEASRFGWLLYGTELDMYEIHGGCGFSKKLLYTISQVTYCAARIQQDPASTITPVTARYLYHELLGMRQWSREVAETGSGQERQQTIAWVKGKPDNYVIHTAQEMTDVTAEAWRIATLIYLQCRVLRLPRNHIDVMSNMGDLAKCISVMPTSGSAFTAQAPLLPVFFLGLLATDPKHKIVSQRWFEQVVQTPVRSSVPPLYETLKRIWAWIDTEVPVPSEPAALNKSLGLRSPWWESLVTKVQDKEEETLCLT